MGKYFDAIEFPETKDPGVKPVAPPEPKWNAEEIKNALAFIYGELETVKIGNNKYTAYAIDPGKGGFFAIQNTLNSFKACPNDKTLAGAVQIAEQDLGTRFAAMVKKALEATKEAPNGY